jgi:hypothetical protein
MALMLDKNTPRRPSAVAPPNNSSPTAKVSPLSSPKNSALDDHPPPSSVETVSPSLSESAYNLEHVLNTPHHYDKIYTVLPMSSSMSFFGDFNSVPALSEENSRASLVQSRDRASGVSRVPSMDLSMSSSSLSFSSSSSRPGAVSKPMRQFLQDLRLLERRLGAIGLMPFPHSAAAADLREKESVTSKSALTSSAARLNFLSSRLDESFIVLQQTGGASGPSPLPPTTRRGERQTQTQTQPASQPSPYGNSNSSSDGSGSDRGRGSSTSLSSSSSSSSDQVSYWGGAGRGLLQMASKMTGIASPEDQSRAAAATAVGVLSSAPYGGAAAQQQQQKPQGGGGGTQGAESSTLLEGAKVIDGTSSSHDVVGYETSQSVNWNACSTMLPSAASTPSTEANITSNGLSVAGDHSSGRVRGDSWESVSSSGVLEREERAASSRSRAGARGSGSAAGSGGDGVLRLLSTIERLST